MMEHNWGRDNGNQWNPPTWLTNTSRHQPQQNNNTQVDNITVTNTNTDITVITDPFYEPFGDRLQTQKPPNTFHVALQNFGGWPQWNNQEKNDNICLCCSDHQFDVLVTTKNNVAWH